MLERVIKSTRVFSFRKLLSAVKRQMNKDWARPVPAAAVIPAARVVATITGLKAFVAGLLSLWGNLPA